MAVHVLGCRDLKSPNLLVDKDYTCKVGTGLLPQLPRSDPGNVLQLGVQSIFSIWWLGAGIVTERASCACQKVGLTGCWVPPPPAGVRLWAVARAAQHLAVRQEPGRHARVDRARGPPLPGARVILGFLGSWVISAHGSAEVRPCGVSGAVLSGHVFWHHMRCSGACHRTTPGCLGQAHAVQRCLQRCFCASIAFLATHLQGPVRYN